MKKKFLTTISIALCSFGIASAQNITETSSGVANTQSAPEQVVAPSAEPSAPQAEATASEPAAAPAQPVKFVYATPAPAPAPVQASAQPVPVQKQAAQQPIVAPAKHPVPVAKEVPSYTKQTLHYGVQGSIGHTEFNGNVEFDQGLIWNAGAFATVPLSEYLFNFEIGAQFIYRKVTNSTTRYNYKTNEDEARKDMITSYTLGFPLQMNINAGKAQIVYFSVGTEIEIPLYNQLRVSSNGNELTKKELQKDCAPLFWDMGFGVGVNATKHFSIYGRFSIGLSDIYDDVYINNTESKEYWSLYPIDFSIGTKLFF